jgi:hypothetical protein
MPLLLLAAEELVEELKLCRGSRYKESDTCQGEE